MRSCRLDTFPAAHRFHSMTHDEVDDMVGRLGVAIDRARDSHPIGTDFSISSSLAADPV